jgi:hypothetical protein
MQRGIAPDALRLFLHTDPGNISKSAPLDISLYSGTAPRCKTHPTQPNADVALIELDKAAILSTFCVKAWSSQNFLPTRFLLDPGEDVFIMGYAQAFHDQVHNLPLFRSAMIASAYPVPFNGQPLFLTDENFHPGTSGSPVITKPKNAWVDDQGNTNMLPGGIYYLLGIHSGVVDPRVTGGQAVGLGAAWYIQLAEDIASTF